MSEVKIDTVQKLFHDPTVKSETSGRNAQLHQFLIFGGSIGRNTLLTPQDLFDTKQQFQNMRYHDGHDVFTSDSLYNWQQWVLKKISDIASSHEQKNLIKKKTDQEIMKKTKIEMNLFHINIDVSNIIVFILI